jgi:hypothetical protein
MLSLNRIGLFLLLWALAFRSADVIAQTCEDVNCDCAVIAETSWREVCETQEAKVRSECSASGGKVRSYCGLHGPSGFPVATSIQTQKLRSDASEDAKTLLKQVDAQKWSSAETYTAFETAMQSGNFAQAAQLAALVDSDNAKLFTLQRQTITALMKEESADVDVIAQSFGAFNGDKALALANLSEVQWQRSLVTADENARRAIAVLSFRLGRAAASAYEYTADMYAAGSLLEEAANVWQQAASMSQKLIAWEAETSKDAQRIRYYQAQAAARWHTATYYWLQAKNEEQVARSMKSAESIAGLGGF